MIQDKILDALISIPYLDAVLTVFSFVPVVQVYALSLLATISSYKAKLALKEGDWKRAALFIASAATAASSAMSFAAKARVAADAAKVGNTLTADQLATKVGETQLGQTAAKLTTTSKHIKYAIATHTKLRW